jgi:hypothetical protein
MTNSFFKSPKRYKISQSHQIRRFIFIFIFLHVQQEGGREIRTNDLHFLRRGSQPIELPIGDKYKDLLIFPYFTLIQNIIFFFLRRRRVINSLYDRPSRSSRGQRKVGEKEKKKRGKSLTVRSWQTACIEKSHVRNIIYRKSEGKNLAHLSDFELIENTSQFKLGHLNLCI